MLHYEVYIDSLFLLNTVMDYLLLRMLGKIMRCTATHLNYLKGAIFGALMNCVLLMCSWIPYPFRAFIGVSVVTTGMVVIGLKKKGIRILIKCVCIYIILTVIMGGFLEWLSLRLTAFSGKKITLYYIVVAAVVFMEVAELIWNIYLKERKRENHLYPVTMQIENDLIDTLALLDTGNSLMEPIFKKPVSIVEKGIIPATADFYLKEHYVAIPYHSVGKMNGMLAGCRITKIIIHKEDEMINWENPIIGLCEGNLSKKENYHVILHPDLMNQ